MRRQILTRADPVESDRRGAGKGASSPDFGPDRRHGHGAHPRYRDAIFMALGTGEPTRTNAHVRGSNATFDRVRIRRPTLTGRKT
jgi:hypothetical protein